MRRIAYFLVVAAILPLVTDYGFANQTPNPTLSVPASAESGKLITVTGSSPSGEAGTTIRLSDDDGKIKPVSVVWQGSEFTVKFYAPKFNEENPENEVEIKVRPLAPSRALLEYVPVSPATAA